MIKKFILVLIVGVAGTVAWGQNLSKLPDYIEGTSKAMQALDDEVRGWRRKMVTPEQFDDMVQRIQKQIDKNKNDRAEGYLRLGQMYRLRSCPERSNDSLAKVYYLKAEELLTRECDVPFLQTMDYFLARCYMQPGEKQDLHKAQQHLLNCIHTRTQITSTLGDHYLFGWCGVTDVYLALQCYILGIVNGCLDFTHDIEYLRYTVDHYEDMMKHPESYALIEDHVLTSTMESSTKAGIYPIELAARLGNPSAMCNMSNKYRNGILSGTKEECFLKAYELMKDTTKWDFVTMPYEMALICLNGNIEPLTGKELPKNDKGEYELEPKRAAIKKCIEYLEMSASEGYLSSMNVLSQIYANIEDDPAIEPNYERAVFWIKVIEFTSGLSDDSFAKKTQKKLKDKNIWANQIDSLFVTTNAENFALNKLYELKDLSDRIDQRKGYQHPTRREHSNINLGVDPKMIEEMNKQHVMKGNASDYLRAEVYATIYQYYEWRLQKLGNEEGRMSGHMRRFCQQMMVGLREHSEALPFNMIKESEWESWRGK